jgi:hypothetical protein
MTAAGPLRPHAKRLTFPTPRTFMDASADPVAIREPERTSQTQAEPLDHRNVDAMDRIGQSSECRLTITIEFRNATSRFVRRDELCRIGGCR